MIRKLLVTSIAVANAAVMLPANAQPQSGLQAIEEIQVFSNARRSQGLADVNAAVSVIGEQELDLIAHTHYQEALSRVPGVSAHRNNGQESLMAIRSPVLTGAGACGAFLVAENGIPVRSHGFCNVNEMFDAHTENASRIEVIRGPASAFWGSNAVHGMINVVLPEPGDAGQLYLEAGPRGTDRVKAVIGQDHGNFKQILLLNGISEEGYRADSGYDQQKASWLYEYNAGGTQLEGGISFNNLNQETAGFVTGTNNFRGSQRDTNPNPEAYRDSKNIRAWTRISRRVDDWDLVFTPYFRDVDMNFLQHFLPGQPMEDTDVRSIGLQVQGYRDLDSGARLAVGFDTEDSTGKLLQFQPNATQGSFFLQNSIPRGRHYDYEVDARQMGAFVNYEQTIWGNWELSLGLRLENVSYDYDNLMIDGRTDENGVPCGFGCRYNRPADRDDSFTDVSPKIGLSYPLNDNNNLQLRMQRGVRAPQATELYRLQNDQSVADLDSVELDSYEVALNGATTNFDYTASLYFMDKQNGIVTNSDRENLNGSHTRHIGLELGANWDIDDILSLRGVFNFAKHTYENNQMSGGFNIDGMEVDTAPNAFGNLRLTYRPYNDVLMEVEYVHMGDYYTNPENTASYDGHELVNLRMQYQYMDDVMISLNILNVTDQEYAERADWTTFTGDRYFPGEPARAFLGLTWNFR